MPVNFSAIYNAIPTLFGNSIAGTAMTGLVRIPALLCNLTAIAMVGEISIRSLSKILSTFNIGNNPDNWVTNSAEKISNSGIRPYREMPIKQLVIKAVAFTLLGIAATEFVNVIGGHAPAIYNNVLTFMGPIRLDNASYFTNIRPILAAAGVTV